MEINYKEGMFLGKEELYRQNLLQNSFAECFSNLFGLDLSVNSAQTKYFQHFGILNPKKIGVENSVVTINGVQGLKLSLADKKRSKCLAQTGRATIGFDSEGQEIGMVSSDDFTGKECFIPQNQFPVSSDIKTIYVKVSAQYTNYENALLTVTSDGVGRVTVGWDRVKALFRNGSEGRYAKIKTSQGTILTVSSVDYENASIQFAGLQNTFQAQNDVQFMFLQTLSPFVAEESEPLYKYASCNLELAEEATGSDLNYLAFLYINSNGSFTVLGFADVDLNYIDATLYKNAVKSVHIGDGQVLTAKLGNKSVTSEKLADNSVNKSKMDFNAFGYRKVHFENTTVTQNVILEPGEYFVGEQIGDLPTLNKKFTLFAPDDFTDDDCRAQVTSVFLKNISSGRTLMDFFYADPVSIYGLSMLEFSPDSEYAYFISFHWIDRTSCVVSLVQKINLNV